jgi:uncharacterized membrane protein
MTSSNQFSSYPIKLTDRFILWFSRHWVMVVSFLVGFYVLSPFLAPVFMNAGLTLPGNAIYLIYSFLCHQLPERSYFLFGPKISYSLIEIQSVWKNTTDIAVLRQFIGTPQMGWKVAWSDRMVSMFTSLWLFGILWGGFKKKIKPLPLWGLILLLLPMAVDGTSHLFSDLAGLGQGFRDTNTWLATLSNNAFPSAFYAGDAWGSFNAWMRLITGVIFGLGVVWFCFPVLEDIFTNFQQAVEYKYHHQDLLRREKERLLSLTLTTVPGQSSQTVNINSKEETGMEGSK